jgi:hypothetical protein
MRPVVLGDQVRTGPLPHEGDPVLHAEFAGLAAQLLDIVIVVVDEPQDEPWRQVG